MLVLNLPFKALMFLTLMRPSLVLFLVLWLKLVKDFLTSFSHSTRNNTVGMGDAGIKSAIQGSNVPNPDEAVPSFVSGAMAKAGKGLLEGTLQEIGRASCRERVHVAVVDVSIEEKTDTI